jgi:DNA-binding MarR family transcriptional regulator
LKFEEEIKQKKFKNSSQKAVLNIIFTANWLNTEYRDSFKPFGITQQQYNVLRILKGRYPEAANPSEIKEVMLDKNPDLTRLCDRMISNGWISRDIDTKNRRKMNIKITESGILLLEKIAPLLSKADLKFSKMSDSDLEKLSELLDKIRG